MDESISACILLHIKVGLSHFLLLNLYILIVFSFAGRQDGGFSNLNLFTEI